MRTFPSAALIAPFGIQAAFPACFFYYALFVWYEGAASGSDASTGFAIAAIAIPSGNGVLGFLFATMAISATSHRTHALREVLLTEGLVVVLAVVVLLSGHHLDDADQALLFAMQIGVAAPSTIVLALVLLNRRFRLVARIGDDSRPRPVFNDEPAFHLRARWAWLALGCTSMALAITMVAYGTPRHGVGEGFVATEAVSAGMAAVVFAAVGLMWLVLAAPVRKVTRQSIVVCQVLLALPLFPAYANAGVFVSATITAALAGWLVAWLYLLAPLAGVELRFLPGQRNLANPKEAQANPR